MRKTILLVMGVLYATMAFSLEKVDWIPLTQQGNVKWVYYLTVQGLLDEESGHYTRDTIPYTIEFKGDTLVPIETDIDDHFRMVNPIECKKIYRQFERDVINAYTGDTIYGKEPELIGWAYDFMYATYVHFSDSYRAKTRNFALPITYFIDDEYDKDKFYCLGQAKQTLEATNAYWAHLPEHYYYHFHFDHAQEVEVDGTIRTLYSSDTLQSRNKLPYEHMQVFWMTGVGWFGHFYKSGWSNPHNASTFLSPTGTARGKKYQYIDIGDDLTSIIQNSFFSHQEKDGKVIFKSPWYIGDKNESVGVTSVPSETADRDNRWYNLNGVMFDSKPTQPGVYIHGGKKVIIK